MAKRGSRRQARQARKARENRHSEPRTSTILFCLLLLLGTLALYSPVRTHEFINYDDPTYLSGNSHVTEGLTLNTVRWSLTSSYASNWHPLTWLSHALDWEWFGADAGLHHDTSALLHALNTLLLFIVLRWATQDERPSFVVAALFSWHPLNVESAAWAAEQKTLLCMFFSLLTILAYFRYAGSRSWSRFGVVLAGYVLALASKPMAVTLPFLLLLLDYWPLRRISGWSEPNAVCSIPQESISGIIVEKIPLLVLSAASCAVTIWAQHAGGALKSLRKFPLGLRLGNALDSYVIYISKTLWPSGLGLFYPHPGSSLALWKPILAITLLLAVSVAVWLQRSARPYLIVGWLWFLGTLVPVIGLVQVGDQARADRYTYLPMVGLLVMLVWTVFDLSQRLRLPSVRVWAAISLVLFALCWASFMQIGYWKTNFTIWSHTLEVTEKNSVAENQLAIEFMKRHDPAQAAVHFKNAVDIDPDRIDSRVNLGVIYASQGALVEGIQQLESALRGAENRDLSDEDMGYLSSARINLAFAEMLQNDYPNALINLRQANHAASALLDRTIETVRRSLATAPSEGAYIRLALLLRAKGDSEEASSLLTQAIAANPGYDQSRQLLNFLNTYSN
jgi:protein O-mannosyl-transferase